MMKGLLETHAFCISNYDYVVYHDQHEGYIKVKLIVSMAAIFRAQ